MSTELTAPRDWSKRELKKFGIAYLDKVPHGTSGWQERKVDPYFACMKCGATWPAPKAPDSWRRPNLPDGYWHCTNGCNAPRQDTPTEDQEKGSDQ